jgi:predicted Zn-dependent peptidase
MLLLGVAFAGQAQPRIIPPPAHMQQQTKQPKGGLQENEESSGGYAYTSVPDDPSGTRVYTLDNGLTVYLSRNTDEPRIQTYVAVRAGSKMDPPETTGLAHYLEHMLFKGTDRIGTMDWKAERQKLEQISKLYEQHRNESDPEKKVAIYQEIDRVSAEAAKLAIPNEYDKMLSAMGAKGTNAWTSKEQTVYTNDIPSNELERWADLESLRFETLVLRLFHTELEAVYEEFNMNQDRDSRKVWDGLFGLLYPDHTYGSQNTIGKGEHLKNPSMINIQNYFERYYVPSNMAVCLSGDLDGPSDNGKAGN